MAKTLIKSGLIALSTGSVFNVIGGLAVLYIILNNFSVESYASIAILISIVSIGSKIGLLGIREIIVSDHKHGDVISKYFGFILLWSSLIAFFVFVILKTYYPESIYSGYDSNFIYVGFLIIFQSISNFLISILERDQKFSLMRNSRILRTLLNLFFLIFFLTYNFVEKINILMLSMLYADLAMFFYLFMITRGNLDITKVFQSINEFPSFVFETFSTENKNRAVLSQQTLSTIIDNFPIFISSYFGATTFVSSYSIFQRINGIVGQILLLPAKVVGFSSISKIASLNERRILFKNFVKWQFIILAPIFLIAILLIKDIFIFFDFSSWIGVATLFQIIYLGRIFSLNLGPFPEIVFNLDLFSYYTKLLMLKLIFSFAILTFLFNLNVSISIIGILLMLLNVIPNGVLLFKIRKVLNIKKPYTLWKFDSY